MLTRLADLALVVLALTAGPLLAAPVSHGPTPSIHAPASAPADTDLRRLLGPGGVLVGAIRIKDVGSLSKKFVTRAGAAAGDYKDGVAGAGQDWETNTKNSEDNYKAGVNAAMARGAFGKGVSSAGQAKYTTRAVNLGSQRYGPGVQAGADEWAKNTTPYLQKLASLTLPPPGPRRSPQNQQRANMVALELGKMKEGLA